MLQKFIHINLRFLIFELKNLVGEDVVATLQHF